MASQEFLASFGVEIDEAGVSRLQAVLSENKALAEETAAAFDSAAASIRAFTEELGLPDFSGNGITEEGFSGLNGLNLGLDVTPAGKDLNAFIEKAKKPIDLSANGSGIVSAGRTAYNSIRSIFSTPITIRANVVRTVSGGAGDGSGGRQQASVGGRFSKTTDVQVAEDGDPEYIIPVKKEDRAVPLLKQLLSELSPAAQEKLGNTPFPMHSEPWGGQGAGGVGAAAVTQDNRTVSAPVNIQVHASGTDAEQVGRSLYDTAERYLLRTLRGAFE